MRRLKLICLSALIWSASALSAEAQFAESIQRTSIELGSDLEVELVGLGEGQTCAVEVLYGDGQSASAVVGSKDNPASLRHRYAAPGRYQVSIVGKTRWRGLKTVSACDGPSKEVWVTYGARDAVVARAKTGNEARADTDQRMLAAPTAQRARPVGRETAKRVAVIVANSKYGTDPLVSPRKDAELLEKVLREKLGFTVSVLRDATRAQLIEAIESFEERAHDADSALFYFTGHGAQDSSRRNYMIPVDAAIRGEAGLAGYGVEASLVVDALRRSTAKVGLIVLDACRNLPTGYSMGRKSVVKGLARMDIGTAASGQHDGELLVAFAAEEGMTVEDPATGYSAYAKAFAGQLEFAGRRPIRLMLDNVRDEVRLATNNGQRPMQFGEMRSTSYLVSPDRSVQAQDVLADPDEKLWREVEISRRREAYEQYLTLFPRGRYSDLARAMIRQLDGGSDPRSTKDELVRSGEQREAKDDKTDEAMWERIKGETALHPYLAYQLRFPKGRYAGEAMKKAGFPIKTRSGCALRETETLNDKDVEWSGACLEGLANGRGTKTYFRSNLPYIEWTGMMERGVPVGEWSGKHYDSGPNSRKSTAITYVGSGDIGRIQSYELNNGVAYKGETNATLQALVGVPDGKGVVRFADGGEYSGDWVSGKRTGRGELIYAKSSNPSAGSKYVGELVDGSPSGYGTMTLNSGATYTGNWVNGRRQGQGRMTTADGGRYEGNFSDDKFSGQGTFSFPPRDNPGAAVSYVGEYKEGLFHGDGVMEYKNGRYSGTWKYGKRHGRGILMDSDNGEEYDGEWLDDQRSGQGRHIFPKSHNKDAAVQYVGSYVDGRPNGQGEIKWGNGARYVGEFQNGVPHGYGRLTRPDGSVEAGRFENGKSVSSGAGGNSGTSAPQINVQAQPTIFRYGSNVSCPQISIGNGWARCQ